MDKINLDYDINFDYKNKKLPVEVICRKRKTVSIKVIPKEKIEMIVPNKISKDTIENILIKNSKWILSKLEKFKNYEDFFMKRDYIDGEVYYFLGEPYYLKIIKDKNMDNSIDENINKKNKDSNIQRKDIKNKKSYNFIELKKNNIEIRTNNWEKDYLKESLKKWYKLQSESIVMDRIDFLRKKSEDFRKIKPNVVKIKEQKKIWGSCNASKTIYINSKISMLCIDAIDYIIVHEFCHILHMNHSKDFYKEIQKIIPNYKEITIWLKKNNYKFIL